MPTYVTREEFEARVGVVEREVEGEKLVTRHILEQTRRNGDDLAAVKSRLDRVELRLDRVEHKLDGLDMKFSAFLRDYPAGPSGKSCGRSKGNMAKGLSSRFVMTSPSDSARPRENDGPSAIDWDDLKERIR